MPDKTTIEWTDATWNPIRGCSLVSQGCKNCYAMRVAARFTGPLQAYAGLAKRVNGHPAWTGEVRLIEKHLHDPLKWKEPRRIFVNSMSDLFHEKLSDDAIARVFAVMALAHWHTFQILTKRPQRMRALLASDLFLFLVADYIDDEIGRDPESTLADDLREGIGWPLPHVWPGVSVEDQPTANERIPQLLQTPAALRWISAEPLLRGVDLANLIFDDGEGEIALNALTGVAEVLHSNSMDIISDDERNPRLNWVVCGGESGPGARPMHRDWARSLRDQCKAAGTAFFFKQWGQWSPSPADPTVGKNTGGIFLRHDGSLGKQGDWWEGTAVAMDRQRNKKAAGALLDGQEWREYPDVKVAAALAGTAARRAGRGFAASIVQEL